MDKTFHHLASGWVKETKNGKEYVSFSSNGPKDAVKLVAVLENGTEVEITNFNMYENDKKGNDNWPDYRLVLITDAE